MTSFLTEWGGKILFTLIFFLPAYLANMFPVIFLKTSFLVNLRKPIDMGRKWHGKRVLGDNKTFYGIVTAVIGGAIGAPLAVFIFYSADGGLVNLLNTEFWHLVWYFITLLFIGGYVGLGAIMGDIIKSFFKRRMGIAPGKPLIFFDQVDFIIGAWVAIMFLEWLLNVQSGIDWQILLISLIITPLLHLGANYIAFRLKWKKVWW